MDCYTELGVPDNLITLIKSFHQDMKARLRVDGEMLQEIELANGQRQGCTMAPTLFNFMLVLLLNDGWTG